MKIELMLRRTAAEPIVFTLGGVGVAIRTLYGKHDVRGARSKAAGLAAAASAVAC